MADHPADPPMDPLTQAEFSALVERYSLELWRFLGGLTGSPEQARDLAQDTFYDAWRAVQRRARPFVTGTDPEEMRRWLYHTAYCRAISARRRFRLIQWDSLDAGGLPEAEQLASLPSFEDAVAESEAMRSALARLSAEDAACLLLMVVAGFTAAESAAILGASVQAVAKRLSRAKQRLLAAYLAEESRSQEGTPR